MKNDLILSISYYINFFYLSVVIGFIITVVNLTILISLKNSGKISRECLCYNFFYFLYVFFENEIYTQYISMSAKVIKFSIQLDIFLWAAYYVGYRYKKIP